MSTMRLKNQLLRSVRIKYLQKPLFCLSKYRIVHLEFNVEAKGVNSKLGYKTAIHKTEVLQDDMYNFAIRNIDQERNELIYIDNSCFYENSKAFKMAIKQFLFIDHKDLSEYLESEECEMADLNESIPETPEEIQQIIKVYNYIMDNE